MASKKPNPPCFERQLKAILKKFPKSEQAIHKAIEDLGKKPKQGDQIPGLGANNVRKIRLPLTEYDISKQKGLRVILLIINDDVLMIAIYFKGNYRSEKDIMNLIKKNLKEINKDYN